MIFSLTDEYIFPHPELSEDSGLLAVGGDLDPQRLLLAYANGIFPWFNPEDEIMWWSSPFRPVFIPGKVKVSKSLRASMRKHKFEIKLDSNFKEVIENCATVERKDQDLTWISDEIKDSYQVLFDLGYLHTVEVYLEGKMVGGLYGVSLGRAFFGESMFQTVSDASKVALFALSEMLKEWEFLFIDSQVSNPHSYRMGARELTKKDFLSLLTNSLDFDTIRGKWEYDFTKVSYLYAR